MKKIPGVLAFSLFLLASCGNHEQPTANSSTADMQQQQDSIRHAQINKVAIINEKDPVCDMPLTRGFDDTVIRDGKVIGFCSKECKDEYTAKPDSFKIK